MVSAFPTRSQRLDHVFMTLFVLALLAATVLIDSGYFAQNAGTWMRSSVGIVGGRTRVQRARPMFRSASEPWSMSVVSSIRLKRPSGAKSPKT